ncbi:MAG: hypothetical protein AAF989_10435, partial [Planctomycetota bacterium]
DPDPSDPDPSDPDPSEIGRWRTRALANSGASAPRGTQGVTDAGRQGLLLKGSAPERTRLIRVDSFPSFIRTNSWLHLPFPLADGCLPRQRSTVGLQELS